MIFYIDNTLIIEYNKTKQKRKDAKWRRVVIMKYEEMTMDQINEITRRGGDQLRKLNKAVADYLDGLKLSDKAREQISQTDINNMADVFGGCFTSEEVEEVVNSYCED